VQALVGAGEPLEVVAGRGPRGRQRRDHDRGEIREHVGEERAGERRAVAAVGEHGHRGAVVEHPQERELADRPAVVAVRAMRAPVEQHPAEPPAIAGAVPIRHLDLRCLHRVDRARRQHARTIGGDAALGVECSKAQHVLGRGVY
jgi:hypothetical protein